MTWILLSLLAMALLAGIANGFLCTMLSIFFTGKLEKDADFLTFGGGALLVLIFFSSGGLAIVPLKFVPAGIVMIFGGFVFGSHLTFLGCRRLFPRK